MSMFNIDDKVWVASFGRVAKQIPCPDCGGTKKLHVTLFDGSEFDIACAGCAGGYEPPRGYVTIQEWQADAELHTVTGVQSKKDAPPTYYFEGGRLDYDGRTFATREEAIARADELRHAYEADENRRLLAKTKDHRSWAWHVHYHRDCAKSHREKAAYHERMCAHAKTQSKEAA